ncbi:MAG: YafY family protein [Caldilineaceae bacterium]
MRADRLLSILLLLQVRRRATARELADQLQVSARTIQRDMEALSMAGIPVYADRGTGGGWSLLDGYETKLTGLNESEIQALFLTNPARLLADLGLSKAAEAARDKLLAALPAMHRRDAEYIRQRIHIDVTSWQRSQGDITYLSLLQEAIWQERQVIITYELSSGPIIEPLLDPLGLVAKGSTWYLIAGDEGKIGVYRISRVYAAAITAQPCVRPCNFDLAAFWAESAANFVANLPKYPVTVRVDPAILSRLRCAGRFSRIEQVYPTQGDGWQEVDIMFETAKEACEYVLSFGPQIEVIAPAELRAEVITRAEAILARCRSEG